MSQVFLLFLCLNLLLREGEKKNTNYWDTWANWDSRAGMLFFKAAHPIGHAMPPPSVEGVAGLEGGRIGLAHRRTHTRQTGSPRRGYNGRDSRRAWCPNTLRGRGDHPAVQVRRLPVRPRGVRLAISKDELFPYERQVVITKCGCPLKASEVTLAAVVKRCPHQLISNKLAPHMPDEIQLMQMKDLFCHLRRT